MPTQETIKQDTAKQDAQNVSKTAAEQGVRQKNAAEKTAAEQSTVKQNAAKQDIKQSVEETAERYSKAVEEMRAFDSEDEERPARKLGDQLLTVKDLRCGYGKKKPVEIVHGVSFDVHVGEFVCIIGANGCGKTTTLKAIMGLLPQLGGSVEFDGENIAKMEERRRAKHFAYIPQAHTPPFPFTVADVVLMGRTPYVNLLARTTQRDRNVAMQALELLGITHLAHKDYTGLSGGQQQLVLIARALTQESDILIMDEPTAALDFGNQQLVLSRMHMLSRMGKAVIMVTHDPDHALFCADKVVVMDEGAVLQEGTPDDCITTETLRHIYNAEAYVMDVEVPTGEIVRACVPLNAAR